MFDPTMLVDEHDRRAERHLLELELEQVKQNNDHLWLWIGALIEHAGDVELAEEEVMEQQESA